MHLSQCTAPFEEMLPRDDLSTTVQTQNTRLILASRSAATRTLGIFELLENVAAYLDPRDIFVLRRVNKIWRNVLEQKHFASRLVFRMPENEYELSEHPLAPPFCEYVDTFNMSYRLADEAEGILGLRIYSSQGSLEDFSNTSTFAMGSWRKVPAFNKSTRKVQLQCLRHDEIVRVDIAASTRCITFGDLANVWLCIAAREDVIVTGNDFINFETYVNTNGEAVLLEQCAMKPDWRPWQRMSLANETIQVD